MHMVFKLMLTVLLLLDVLLCMALLLLVMCV